MKPNLLVAIILPVFSVCPTFPVLVKSIPQSYGLQTPPAHADNPYKTIGEIPPPAGFSRIRPEKNSFAEWLGNIGLKKNKTVFLFDGRPKTNQSAQFAVLDISVGKKDLQQCADAIMRLKAEYLYSVKRFDEIGFVDNNQKRYILGPEKDRPHFDAYLEKVFLHCGTLSLEKQLKPLRALSDLQTGDVLIQGGSPGHAMLIVNMAIQAKTGEKIYLLAQGYMPAQDIHVVVNPGQGTNNPWYALRPGPVDTPEWDFPKGHFKTW
jgi:Domain of unknown function (4846)